jgi:HSP20 family protein
MPKVIRKPASSASSSNEIQHALFHAVGWSHVHVRSNLWSPPTDLYEMDEAYVVRVEIAGMREDDFSVTVEDNYLIVSGERPDIPERRAYHQMEIRFGRFATAIGLPGPANVDQAQAEYRDGFLTITLPKAPVNPILIQDES